MWIRQILVAVVGLASGFAVAAGLFSFIIGLGVVSDFADRTHTGKHVMLYEKLHYGRWDPWKYFLGIRARDAWRQMDRSGVWTFLPEFFVGCWSMALAEILNIFPIFIRRIKIPEMCAMADFWDGAWEKPWSTSVFPIK